MAKQTSTMRNSCDVMDHLLLSDSVVVDIALRNVKCDCPFVQTTVCGLYSKVGQILLSDSSFTLMQSKNMKAKLK